MQDHPVQDDPKHDDPKDGDPTHGDQGAGAYDSSGGFRLEHEATSPRRRRSGQRTLRLILRLFMVAAIVALALQRGMPMSEFGGLALLIGVALALPFAARILWRQFARMGLRGPALVVATVAGLIALLALFAMAARSVLVEALGGG